MFNWFRARSSSILGIDITSTCIKAVQVLQQDKKFYIENYNYSALPAGLIDSHKIKDPAVLACCLKTALSGFKSRVEQVVIAVPDSLVLSRVIKVSNKFKDADLEELVTIEAAKFILSPLNEVSLDFRVLEPSLKEANSREILISACRLEHVESRVEALTLAGWEPQTVAVESAAIEQILPFLIAGLLLEEKHQLLAVININSELITLFIFKNEEKIFTTELLFAELFLSALINPYENLSSQPFIEDQEDLVLEKVLLQVKRMLQLFFSTHPSITIDCLLFIGVAAHFPKLSFFAQQQLGIPSYVANPFKQIKVSASVDQAFLLERGSALTMACGLALRV